MTKLLNCPGLYKTRAKYYKVACVGLRVCVCVCFSWAWSVWSETFLSCQTSCAENHRETAVYIMYDVYLCVCVSEGNCCRAIRHQLATWTVLRPPVEEELLLYLEEKEFPSRFVALHLIIISNCLFFIGLFPVT